MEKSVVEWIEYLSKKRSELNGWSICPFAKKALMDKKIFWTSIAYEPEEFISRYMESFTGEYEVIIFFNLSKNLTNEDCTSIVRSLNKTFKDTVFLKDHPTEPGYINDVSTGNGEYPIILAQPKSRLLDARGTLTKTNYYDSWSDEYKNEIWSYGDES